MRHHRTRVKPSKTTSLMGMIVGGLFVILGVTTILPTFGFFGIIWTLVALGITIYHAVNVFSTRGVSMYDITTTQSSAAPASQVDRLDNELRKLHKLKEDGLITEEEYQKKREQLLK